MRKFNAFLTVCCLAAVMVGCAPEAKPVPKSGGGGTNPAQTPDSPGSVRK